MRWYIVHISITVTSKICTRKFNFSVQIGNTITGPGHVLYKIGRGIANTSIVIGDFKKSSQVVAITINIFALGINAMSPLVNALGI